MIKQFIKFIVERHTVYQRRLSGAVPPWSEDPIFQNYRFCNVYRELDKTTQWLAKNWRLPNQNDPHLWFAMAVARRVNLSATLDQVGYPVPWNEKSFMEALTLRKAAGEQMFSGAYMITTGGSTKPWALYNAQDVFTKLWQLRHQVPNPELGLRSLHVWLSSMRGYGGGFLAAQVVADVKYAPAWSTASDWFTFAAPGPGSKRGLARVLNKEPNINWFAGQWHSELLKVQLIANSAIRKYDMPALHAQDIQNCCCEFDKYERARSGERSSLQRFIAA